MPVATKKSQGSSEFGLNRAIAIILLFVSLSCAITFGVLRHKENSHTKLSDIEGKWAEPQGVRGDGAMTIDANSMTVQYERAPGPYCIVSTRNKNGWLELELLWRPDHFRTKLRVRILSQNRLHCVDDDGTTGQIRSRM